MKVAASAKDAATMLVFRLSDGSDSCVKCITDALDGTDASRGTVRVTGCRILILQSVSVPFVCQETRSHKGSCDASTGE